MPKLPQLRPEHKSMSISSPAFFHAWTYAYMYVYMQLSYAFNKSLAHASKSSHKCNGNEKRLRAPSWWPKRNWKSEKGSKGGGRLGVPLPVEPGPIPCQYF